MGWRFMRLSEIFNLRPRLPISYHRSLTLDLSKWFRSAPDVSIALIQTINPDGAFWFYAAVNLLALGFIC